MDDEISITGGCNCGAIRYTLTTRPLSVVACHCRTCRRQSGAPYSLNLVVRARSVSVEGEPASWLDHTTKSGQPLVREFCGGCGSPIRSLPSATPKIQVIKAGTLDEPDSYQPTSHIWTASKLPWVTIAEGVPQYEGELPV